MFILSDITLAQADCQLVLNAGLTLRKMRDR